MKNKYNNDAIIGGGNITASLTKKGELLRVMYPQPDFRNWIDEFLTGIKVNDSNIIYLHDDVNNEYSQYYSENTNVLHTDIFNTYFGLSVKQTDFALLKDSILVRKYEFENKNNIDHLSPTKKDTNFKVFFCCIQQDFGRKQSYNPRAGGGRWTGTWVLASESSQVFEFLAQ